MALSPRSAINPIPWFVRPDGTWELTRDAAERALAGAAAAGFSAVHVEITPDLTASAYAKLLAQYGLAPAPGYFGPAFEDVEAFPDILERARLHASQHAELGLTETFIASRLVDERRARPAIGSDFDQHRLDGIIDRLGQVCKAMVSEGVLPCLHSHVGTWIETETEIRTVLDGIDSNLLAFGPDTGHMTWARMDPVRVISDYSDRVKAFHIKDADQAAIDRSHEQHLTYFEATRHAHVWTEPGRGDIDLHAAFAAIANKFTGWFVIETDVPKLPTKEESTAAAARWIESLPELASFATVAS